MGVDIYGVKPILRTRKPHRPGGTVDFDSPKWKSYYDRIDKWREENVGYYFRNNWWYWRPIVAIILENADFDLHDERKVEDLYQRMSHNDGRIVGKRYIPIFIDAIDKVLEDEDKILYYENEYESSDYVFDIDNLKNFKDFLIESGGFRVF